MKKYKKIAGMKFYSFEDLLAEFSRSKKFVEGYEKELTRIRLAAQIRDIRTVQRLTQKEIAQKAKMPQSVVSRIESGEHSISLETLDRIAKALKKQIVLI